MPVHRHEGAMSKSDSTHLGAGTILALARAKPSGVGGLSAFSSATVCDRFAPPWANPVVNQPATKSLINVFNPFRMAVVLRYAAIQSRSSGKFDFRVVI